MAGTGPEGGAEVSCGRRQVPKVEGFGGQREGFVLRAESFSYSSLGSCWRIGLMSKNKKGIRTKSE